MPEFVQGGIIVIGVAVLIKVFGLEKYL